MSEARGNQEPSMEEILASIRRIIAEDNDAPAEPAVAVPADPPPVSAPAAPAVPVPPPAPTPPRFVPPPAEDILELTEVVEDEPTPVREPTPEPPPPFREPVREPPMREPEIPPAREPERPASFDPFDALVSNTTAAASSAAFASISSRLGEQRRPVYLGNGNATLEEIVRDLLRPMLREWLDENLPGLVERIVAEEVERLAREIK